MARDCVFMSCDCEDEPSPVVRDIIHTRDRAVKAHGPSRNSLDSEILDAVKNYVAEDEATVDDLEKDLDFLFEHWERFRA